MLSGELVLGFFTLSVCATLGWLYVREVRRAVDLQRNVLIGAVAVATTSAGISLYYDWRNKMEQDVVNRMRAAQQQQR